MLIETERLLLREPRDEDFPSFWDMLCDHEARQFTGGVPTCTKDARYLLFREDCKAFLKDGNAEFSVIEKNSGTYLGYCGFRSIEKPGQAELLFGLIKSAWGQGYSREAAEASLYAGFTLLSLSRIVSSACPQNIASRRILQGLGMKETFDKGDADGEAMFLYSLTKEEYVAAQGKDQTRQNKNIEVL